MAKMAQTQTLLILMVCCSYIYCAARNPDQTATQNKQKTLQQLCEKLCAHEHPCPPECYDFMDVWSDDSGNVEKRSSGIDGFTFDDYLFLRWLGRDMARRRRLQK